MQTFEKGGTNLRVFIKGFVVLGQNYPSVNSISGEKLHNFDIKVFFPAREVHLHHPLLNSPFKGH